MLQMNGINKNNVYTILLNFIPQVLLVLQQLAKHVHSDAHPAHAAQQPTTDAILDIYQEDYQIIKR